MKMKNGMYLFATAIVASTMGLASCSNDEEAVGVATPPQVAATKITLGVYANGMPEPHKRSTAEEVNMGSQTQAINQVAVVPVANGAYQAPIVFQGISAGEKQTEVKTVSLLETVDEFLVYGNIDAGKIKETADAFDGFTLSPAELSGGKNGDVSVTDVKEPYGLYYYKDAKRFSTSTYTFTNAQNEFWTESPSWGTEEEQEIKGKTGVKISGVGYGVGVLVGAVRQSTKYVEGQFDDFDNSGSNWDTEISAKMDLKGVIVEGQPGSLNEKFEQAGADVKVYSTAVKEDWQSSALSFTGDDGKVADANTYTVVAEEDKDILVTFQVQNNTGKNLNLKNGGDVANGGYVYYTAKLANKDGKNVFEKATTTLLNANIQDWGNGTTTPPEKTDVFIGVEFDMQWKQGIVYDMDI